MYRTLALFAALTALTSPVQAATDDSPSQIVGRLYAPYLANPHAEPDDTASAMDRIRPFATKAFSAAIDKDQACMKREGGICSLDWDVIINGQDWELSDFSLSEVWPYAPPVIVTATFHNGGDVQQVKFYFIQEGIAWKIDDIEDQFLDDGGKVKELVSIKTLLSKD